MTVFNKSHKSEQIFKNLGKNEGKIEKLFDSMKEVYMIAFLLGAIKKEKKAIDKKSQDSIKDIYFNSEDKSLMDLVTLDLTKDINTLNKTNESQGYIHDLVEQYANRGIDELDELLNHNHFDLDNLIATIKNYEDIIKPKKASIADIIFEVNNKCN